MSDATGLSSPTNDNGMLYQSSATDASETSVGFSQLLQAADDTHADLEFPLAGKDPETSHATSETLPQVLEASYAIEESAETLPPSPSGSSADAVASEEAGALIVESMVADETPVNNNRGWLPSLWGAASPQQDGLHAPLLTARHAAAETPVTHLLSSSPSSTQHGNTPLDRARETVDAVIEDDQTFEVSMTLNGTIQGVMRILGDPQLLRLWCDPIEALVVTSSSTESSANESPSPRRSAERPNNERDTDREYDGEWIEATTTALGSPPSSIGFLYGVGQSVMESLGFASYGRITMFVERRHGRVGLSIGPFHGGISASHAITVSIDGTNKSGQVKVTDRVRLVKDEQDVSLSSFFMCGAFESCLGQCVLPSIGGHMNQVMTSMARFKLLAESSAASSGTQSIMVVGS